MKAQIYSLKAAALMALALLASCAGNQKSTTATLAPNLKNAFANQFVMGTALSRAQIQNAPPGIQSFVVSQFNGVTAENSMKWEKVQPVEGQFDWHASDQLVRFAHAQHLHLTGHVLLWHQQTPDWVFEQASGKPANKALLEERLRTHIKTFVGRYQGRVNAWDVVNEALNEDGTLRQSKWLSILGEDYIELAFSLAHQADPKADLIYNDYNLYKPAKRDGAIAIIKRLQHKGIPIHGVGMQAHYSLNHPEDLALVEQAIVAFAKAGVKVHITELDITVLPTPDPENQGADISQNFALQEKYNPYTNGLPADVEAQFNQRYLDLFKIFIKHSDKIARVTLWGVNDDQSWRNGWPMPGRTDYPLLIDRNNQLKPAAVEIIEEAEAVKRKM